MGCKKKLRTQEYYLGYCFGAAMAEKDRNDTKSQSKGQDEVSCNNPPDGEKYGNLQYKGSSRKKVGSD